MQHAAMSGNSCNGIFQKEAIIMDHKVRDDDDDGDDSESLSSFLNGHNTDDKN
jgi:hypothetical protein